MAPDDIAHLNSIAAANSQTSYRQALREYFVTVFSAIAEQQDLNHESRLYAGKLTRRVVNAAGSTIYKVKYGYEAFTGGSKDLLTILLKTNETGIVAKIFDERRPNEPVLLADIRDGATRLNDSALAMAFEKAGKVITEAFEALKAEVDETARLRLVDANKPQGLRAVA